MQTLSPCLVAGLLLAAIPVLNHYNLAAPTATDTLKAVGASRTTAYKLKGAVESMMPGLLARPGRPARPEEEADLDEQNALLHRVRDFVFDHPGCVSGSSLRRTYGESYLLFVLDIWEKGGVSTEALSTATGVPLGTLKDWIRGERPQVEAPATLAAAPTANVSKIETIVTEYPRWKGGFLSFCGHVQFNLRIPFGRAYLDSILQAHGLRQPKSRKRSRDSSANRGGFETFFANAQWVGDGCELTVGLWGRDFKVNLELLVDAETGAFTGASVRPTEDAVAVIEAFADGVATATEAPVAVLLDNKPSNHAESVEEALGDTLLMRSRPHIPTDKAHIEGAFGLFSQEAPELLLSGETPEQIASEVTALVVTTWLRAVNHRPRADRENKSRVDLFGDGQPTEAELEAAKAALRERKRRQDLARETRRRRQDPIAHARLDAAFDRLCLDDPDRHLRVAIASWPLAAVIEGIAVFEGKKRAGTLPEGVDGRYLKGIVKNIAEEREGMEIAEALMRERIAARDLAFEYLGRQRDALEEDAVDIADLAKDYAAKAMAARRGIDRTFWILAATDLICEEPETEHRRLAKLVARRIHATYSVPHRERLATTRLLFAKVFPVG